MNENKQNIRSKNILMLYTIASIINVAPKGVRLSEKRQLTAALCNEIRPQ